MATHLDERHLYRGYALGKLLVALPTRPITRPRNRTCYKTSLQKLTAKTRHKVNDPIRSDSIRTVALHPLTQGHEVIVVKQRPDQ